MTSSILFPLTSFFSLFYIQRSGGTRKISWSSTLKKGILPHENSFHRKNVFPVKHLLARLPGKTLSFPHSLLERGQAFKGPRKFCSRASMPIAVEELDQPIEEDKVRTAPHSVSREIPIG
jgi:hypothetical protein